jgi:prephenate dehydrogenase
MTGVSAPPFGRVGIVGLGLVGGSVALAARRRWPSIDIAVCDPAPVTREAVAQGLATALVATPGELGACDLIVIATPVQAVPGVLADLTTAGATALVTDTSSTKRVVMQAAKKTPLTFVGGHPVAGAGTAGLAAARADFFDGRPWLLVSTAEGAPEDSRVFEAMLATFVVGLGARPEWTDAVTHDRVMAHVSQAPQVVSTALRDASGAAAAHDDESWQGVLDTNADFIADALGAIAAKLPTSADALTSTPIVRSLFERARALRSLSPTDR